jgi:aminoglycoside phosphotransferase (APT) family kinase protein
VTRPAPPSTEQLSDLLRTARPGWLLVRARPLPGATSTQVTAIETERDGQHATLVLRQYGPANLASDPHAARTEFRLLHLLSAAGLPVPRPYLADESGAILPGPFLLQEYIDGERVDDPPDLTDFASQLAAALAAVHTAGVPRREVSFLADVGDALARTLGTRPARPDEYLHETEVRAALAGMWPPPPVNRPVLLHGDFWPGNVLWRDGRLAGIIDWEDALFGDPLADLAVTRLEICWFHGAAAMDLLTRNYCALRPEVDTSTLPAWDLRAGLRACAFAMPTWGLPAGQLAALRSAHRELITGALARVSAPDGAA